MDFHKTLHRYVPKPGLKCDKLSKVNVKGQGHRGHRSSECLKHFANLCLAQLVMKGCMDFHETL